MQRHGIIGVAGDDEYARSHVAAREPQRDVIAGGEPNLLRGRRADHRGVVPGDARDGLGSLLQPAVVRVFAVADRRIGAENDFERVGIAADAVCAAAAKSACGETEIAGSAVPAITPSCSDVSQRASKALSFSGRWLCQ